MDTFSELRQRGLIDQVTHAELPAKLGDSSLKFYVGFDPTAESFHVGQLAVFNLMRILQQKGHQPIALMGSATGMIGDPSGKDKERNLLTIEQINHNIKTLKPQFELLLDVNSLGSQPIFTNNYDWLSDISMIDFLRDVGKHFAVSQMLGKESVASRLNRASGGITYTEFSYMVLQAYDFMHLNRTYGCSLQLGGSDQWGNIVAGIDLTRRLLQKSVYGLTMPLLVKDDGQKFGKSEAGAIWLDGRLTSPYKFYQFFLRQKDEDVERLLKTLTTIPLDEIADLANQIAKKPELRQAQKRLADELTALLHGAGELASCQKATKALYGGSLHDLTADLLHEIFKEVPSYLVAKDVLEKGWSPVDMLFDIKACRSKSEARNLINGGGLYINNIAHRGMEPILTDHLIGEGLLVVRTGKKNYYLVKLK